MKKDQRNWYILVVSYLFLSLLVMITLFPILNLPTRYAQTVALDWIGLYFVVYSILYKLRYVDYPENMGGEKVSDDEAIQRKYHFYVNLLMGLFLLLGSIHYWIFNPSAGLRLLFLAGTTRIYAYNHIKKKQNKKKQKKM